MTTTLGLVARPSPDGELAEDLTELWVGRHYLPGDVMRSLADEAYETKDAAKKGCESVLRAAEGRPHRRIRLLVAGGARPAHVPAHSARRAVVAARNAWKSLVTTAQR